MSHNLSNVRSTTTVQQGAKADTKFVTDNRGRGGNFKLQERGGGEADGGFFGRPMAEQRVGSRRDFDRSGTVPVVGNLGYVKVVPPPDLNKNTEWFLYPGVWTSYILIIFIGWLLILSVFRCSAGSAWTAVNLIHFAVTYRFFHWKKGSPFGEDQGMYNKLTWWEQVDNGRQLTRNRKFLTVVPVVLYVIASHTTGYRSLSLLLNTIAVFVLLVAKFPNMHRVRIFGINSDYPT